MHNTKKSGTRIQAHVTLYHWDLPQALEDEYGGWVNKKIVRDFTAFANVCFREFGDRVKQWTTINEGNVFAQGGYDIGFLPPQHCSPSSIFNCSKGNSSTEPYLVTHNMLLAHASAATLYRNKYQVTNVYYFIHLGLPSKFGDNGGDLEHDHNTGNDGNFSLPAAVAPEHNERRQRCLSLRRWRML
ncbi:hypothetical protein HN51_057687 [Arachis hypogaea]